MKKASIISIGNELLTGQTTNTNSTYLSDQLLKLGIPVVSSYTIGDQLEPIVRTLKLASADADLVLLTGGLGPTDDDLTRYALAEFLGEKLQISDEFLQKIALFFRKKGIKMPKIAENQALSPANSTPISNDLGTAPGILAHYKGKLLIAMPGVPAEMKKMFQLSILPEVTKLTGRQTLVIRKLKCFGKGESSIAELIGDVMARDRNPQVNCTAELSVITLTIIATTDSHNKALQMALKTEKLLKKRLGNLVYGTDEQTLPEVVGQKLTRQNKSIAIAESCTGGLLAKLLTDVPGASEYFTHGWVAYSNSAKSTELGVPDDLFEKHGAVSSPVAEAMAKAARAKAGADFAISITGIAGPTGATEQKPVGLVYVSLDSNEGLETRRLILSGDRDLIRLRAAYTALNMLRLRLLI